MARPNFLLLVIDCLRADHVYQHGLARTPTIDSLMHEGFSFLNTITTTAVTTPSFASLLTGKYAFEHGVRWHSGFRLNDDTVTLPEALKEQGYNTYAEVSGPLGPEVGINKGFDEYNHRGRRERINVEWGRDLLGRLAGHYRKPWFLMLHVWSLHRRRQVIPECRGRDFGATQYAKAVSSVDVYLSKALPLLPENTVIALTGDHGEDISRGKFDRWQRNVRKKIYRAMRKRGLTDKHVSIAYRDLHEGHGHTVYDSLVRVPFILHRPGVIPHGRTDVQVRHIDLAPTIADLAGADLPPDTTGTSAMPIVRGDDHAHRDAYLEAAGRVMPKQEEWLSGMRVDNRYKYIFAPFLDTFEPELYDLEADPEERNNIARREPAIVEDLHARIQRLKATEVAATPLSGQDQQTVMSRLKDLGYLDD